MKIALVSRDEPPLRGSDQGAYFATLARALAELGHDVHLITENVGARRPALSVEGRVRVRRLNLPGGGVRAERRAMAFAVEAARVVGQLARRGEAEVVEFGDVDGAAAAWLLVRGAMGGAIGGALPTVVSLHSIGDGGTLGVVAAACARMADVVTAPTRARAEAFGGAMGGGAAVRVVAHPVEAWPAAEMGAGRRMVAVVRAEVAGKVDRLAAAWEAARAWEAGWMLHVVAAPNEAPVSAGTLRLAVERGLSAAARAGVSVAVAADAAGVRQAVAEGTACVVALSAGSFCYTAAEAMMLGRVVVVDDAGGVAEMIRGSAAGRVFRRGDAAGLAACLREIAGLSAPELAEAGREARGVILRHCSAAQAAGKRVELYRELLAGRGRVVTVTERLAAWRMLRGAGERAEVRA